MNQDIISISSSNSENREFIHFCYDDKNMDKKSPTILTLNSSGSSYLERVPVSWKAGLNVKKEKLSPYQTPTGVQKVKSWINHSRNSIGMNLNESQNSHVEKKNKFEQEDGPNNLVLCRFDFVKSPSASSSKSSEPLNTTLKNVGSPSRSKSTDRTPSNLSNTRSLRSKSSDVCANVIKSVPKKNSKRLLQKPIKSEEVIRTDEKNEEFFRAKVSDVRSDTSSDVYDVPKSPESQKKELYHYLKLMNPADKKEILSIQNRRSTRVKNLNLMQEKKELEKKLRENNENILNGYENDHYEDNATMKSFKDLDLKIEEHSVVEEYSDDEMSDDDYVFTFPSLSRHSMQSVEHFDSGIKRFLYNIRRSFGHRLEKVRRHLSRVMKQRNASLIKIKLKSKNSLTNGVKHEKAVNGIKNGRVDKIKLRKIANKKFINKHLENTKIAKNSTKKGNSNKKKNVPKKKVLRSTGQLKNVAIKKLMLRQNDPRLPAKKRKKLQNGVKKKSKLLPKKVDKQELDSTCKIVTIASHQGDEDVDLENYMDDMEDFKQLSEEHKRCLIESRILSTKPLPNNIVTSPVMSLLGDNVRKEIKELKVSLGEPDIKTDVSPQHTESNLMHFDYNLFEQFENKCINNVEECFKDDDPVSLEENELSNTPKENEVANTEDECSSVKDDVDEEETELVEKDDGEELRDDHDYANTESSSESDDDESDVIITRSVPRMTQELVNPQRITDVTFEPFSRQTEITSLHRSLVPPERKSHANGLDIGNSSPQSWDSFSSQPKAEKSSRKSRSHSIFISDENGPVLNAFYIDCHLIVSQEYVVSFWAQSALGNVLAAQNMWIPKGHASRIVLNNKCIQKKSMEMVFCMESTVAYIELWTKEHKSEIRQGPVADVFATVYFWKYRQNGLEKKVLQIENINGFADDVQYVVLKNSATIIVSWHSVSENNKISCVHKYSLAPDFATTVNIEMEPINHYVSSLHNIEDCDSLVMGCGENKITLWNIEHGYIVSTIEMNDIKSPLSTLWVKCEKGFLFTIQQCVDRELRLIAINGMNHSWKKLQSYVPPEGYDRLKGVCIDNGNLLSFYDTGILCWNAQSGEPVVEDSTIESQYITSGKHVIVVAQEQIFVKHGLTHLLES